MFVRLNLKRGDPKRPRKTDGNEQCQSSSFVARCFSRCWNSHSITSTMGADDIISWLNAAQNHGVW